MSALLVVSEQVRDAIRQSGLSLREIGRQVGIDGSQLSRFMRGERGLTMSSIDKLAEVLGLKLMKDE